jgi:hypothetical protein
MRQLETFILFLVLPYSISTLKHKSFKAGWSSQVLADCMIVTSLNDNAMKLGSSN